MPCSINEETTLQLFLLLLSLLMDNRLLLVQGWDVNITTLA